MARIARVVLAGVAHHVTQRAIDRRQIFFDDSDYHVYLTGVITTARRSQTEILSYCLMPNHVHWIVVPHREDSLALTFREAHSKYSAYVNAKLGRSGHLWQNRYFSCAMDQGHLWAAMRYVERNPVRAQIVQDAPQFRWSSAAVHAGQTPYPEWLSSQPFASTFNFGEWNILLHADTPAEADIELRKNTHTGRPLGDIHFVEHAQAITGRKLAGRAGKRAVLTTQASAAAS